MNNVVDRINAKGIAEKDFYYSIPSYFLNNSIMLINIEGAEFDLLDAELFSDFSKFALVVEIHDFMRPSDRGLLAKLVSASEKTHWHQIFFIKGRDFSKWNELKILNDDGRSTLISEDRSNFMK